MILSLHPDDLQCEATVHYRYSIFNLVGEAAVSVNRR